MQTGLVDTDAGLKYGPDDVNTGKVPNVVAAAYINNVTPAPAATTLYDLDSTLDVLAVQNPPNAGQLTTVGSLGIDIGAGAAFDIATVTTGGVTTNYGFVLNANTLYSIDLQTGKTTLVGNVGTNLVLRGLVVRPL